MGYNFTMVLSRKRRIEIIFVITTSYMFIELIVGYKTNALSLIADAFHMISDVLSFVVGWYAIHVATRLNCGPFRSYGYQRAEVLGAMINAVFLLALCFTIALDSFQRFANPSAISDVKLVLIVGIIGLVVNIFGLALFHGIYK